MSMRVANHLYFGANLGFAHHFCKGCNEERLHRFDKCVSCKTPFNPYKGRKLKWNDYQTKLGNLNRHQRKALQEL